MEETNFRCKTCGALLVELAQKSQNGLVECPYCHNTWTIPKKETSPAALSFLRMAEHDLDTGKFDDAFTAYKKAAELDENEPEAYFGMALAAFKVQYLKDEVNNRMQPICHEISESVFSDDKNFRRALELATDEQRREYRKRGREIDEIKEEFFDLERKGLDYDCFLCVKVTEEDGRSRTADYDRANDIYYYLKDEGYKPFFSEREMKGRTGSDYEALILYALYRSECMLIVCSNEEYLQTKWVKNEYTRFMAMLLNEAKERDAISFAFCGKPVEKLPSGKKVQGIDLSKPDAYSRIGDFVESHTPEAKKRREQEAAQKRAEEEARNRELAEMREKLKQMEQERANASANTGNLSPEQLLAMMRQAEAEEKKRKEEEERKRREEEARLAAERRAREEEERKRREEEERKLREEEAKKRREEEARLAAERRAREEAERKKREEEERLATERRVGEVAERNTSEEEEERKRKETELKNFIEEQTKKECLADCEITNGILKKYKGKSGYIIIPNGVESIGQAAFAGYLGKTGAYSIIISNSVKSIGDSAFSNSCLMHVTISDSVTSIGNYSFGYCHQLYSVVMGSGVTSIGEGAFAFCTGLTDIKIPDRVTSIGRNAFYTCAGLTDIKIPGSVTSIGRGAFAGCNRIKSVTIPKQFKGIMDMGLKKIFGDNYKSIQFTFTE